MSPRSNINDAYDGESDDRPKAPKDPKPDEPQDPIAGLMKDLDAAKAVHKKAKAGYQKAKEAKVVAVKASCEAQAGVVAARRDMNKAKVPVQKIKGEIISIDPKLAPTL